MTPHGPWHTARMSTDGDYAPSPSRWVRDQVSAIVAAGDTRVVNVPGWPGVVLVTMRGRRSGVVRKVPVIRVEHEGRYAAVASYGGSPRDPQWAHNLRAVPDVDVLDGTTSTPMRARELDGAQREVWWGRAVEVFPDYAQYQTRTERQIPVFLLEPR